MTNSAESASELDSTPLPVDGGSGAAALLTVTFAGKVAMLPRLALPHFVLNVGGSAWTLS